jgi:hypothetical protein
MFMPRVPPYGSDLPVLLLAARLDALSLDSAVCVDDVFLGCGEPLTRGRDLGGLDSALGSFFTITVCCCPKADQSSLYFALAG